MWAWLWELIKIFIKEGFRAFVGFITLILGWNIIFPFIFPSSFVSGAFDYLDLIEISILSITPFIIYLMTHISTHRYLSDQKLKTFSYIFNFILNIAGIFSVMFAYGILSQNAPGAVYFKIIPESINFGHSALVWIFLIFQGSFTPTLLRVDFPTPPKVVFNGFRFNRGSLAKTAALPKSEVSSVAEPKVEPRPEPKVEAASEPKVEVLVEPKPEVSVQPKVEPKPEVSVQPQAGSDPNIGTILKSVEFVANSGIGRSGFRTVERIDGKFAFPDRRGPQPEHGDIWTVEISGVNPKGTVYFVKCLNLESTLKERESQEISVEDSINQGYSQGQ